MLLPDKTRSASHAEASNGFAIATLSVCPLLASGTNAEKETYEITVRTPRKVITGIRLEALIDDSLPLPKKETTASFYDVLPPSEDKPVKPPGEWNQSRVLVQGNHVEHWLNGVLVLEYEAGSEAVKAAVAASKFNKTAGFGARLKGHILLQDHECNVWFRNIKIRVLPAKEQK